jgi:formylglycine-generating enzyme required for sulfatase activity
MAQTFMTVAFAAVPFYIARSIGATPERARVQLRRGLVCSACVLATGAGNLGLLWALDRGLSDRLSTEYRNQEDLDESLDEPPAGAVLGEVHTALADTDSPIRFVVLSGGTFTMGSALGHGEYIEHPRHRVTLSPYLIARTEVTQRQYAEVTGKYPSEDGGGGDVPVDSVSWCDALRFANALSEREPGMEPVYEFSWTSGMSADCDVRWNRDRRGYRLPTEAEWEYAARALVPDRRRSGLDDLRDGAWFSGNSGGYTHPVAELAPNAFGLFDMLGNVQEWVWDGYSVYGSGHEIDPAVPPGSDNPVRLSRGGHAFDRPHEIRVERRVSALSTETWTLNGLRLALSTFEVGPPMEGVSPPHDTTEDPASGSR